MIEETYIVVNVLLKITVLRAQKERRAIEKTSAYLENI